MDFEGSGEIWRDVARFGEIWEVVPGWPVPHSVWDYAAGVDRFSIDVRWIFDGSGVDLGGTGVDLGWIWDGSGVYRGSLVYVGGCRWMLVDVGGLQGTGECVSSYENFLFSTKLHFFRQ